VTLRYGLLGNTDKDILDLQAFHNALFKGMNANYDWFRWYLNDIGSEQHSSTRVYTLRDDERLVGTWCVEPKKFKLNGSIIKVGRCFSVGIHSDYRRRNLFVELSTYAIESERSMFKQYEYVLGFPQVGKPVIDAHIKSGWDRVQLINAYSRVPSSDKITSLKNTYIVDDFGINFVHHEHEGSFVETNQYRNLRWLKHPDNHYTCLGFGNSHIVLKPYAGACHILALDGNVDEIGLLLDTANTLAYRHRFKELTIWNADNEKFHNVIFDREFTRTESECVQSIDLLAVKINSKTSLKLDKCHFQMGSEEGY
jgi:hypothetical protein